MTGSEKIIVAMSGGVDSAVAALQLLRAGADVEGLHMTNWEDDDGYCTAARDYQDARSVCAELGISLHRVNFSREYRERVFADFLAEYAAGRTPNPDVLCNREIKFGAFLEHARRLGGGRIATGHYARLDGRDPVRLLKGRDPDKDQSYFLHAVSGDALVQALFPIGDLRKAEVRALATAAGLPVHAKRDSTGICFIGERPFQEFLGRYVSGSSGPIQTPDGDLVGQHDGLMFYTPGQRQGLHIGGRAGTTGEPWYVAGKLIEDNTLIVVQGREHPLLWSQGLCAAAPSWIAGRPPHAGPQWSLRCCAKTRYRQPDAPCTVTSTGGDRLAVVFDEPQWAIAPGQFVVFYAGDECLGGARIEAAETLQNLPAGPIAASVLTG
ncbi:MAG: tRNA 2-thiouridine(34) synthase MnmA [Gammaproteobacteria bacterium]|nr:tRNA 2-thiouridine(34) synthase MnmA [Gammaproteobacteria bacterium]